MEKLISMLNIAAWIVAVLVPIIVIATTIMQKQYDGSLSESVDAWSGVKASYTHNNKTFVVIWVISIIYLTA